MDLSGGRRGSTTGGTSFCAPTEGSQLAEAVAGDMSPEDSPSDWRSSSSSAHRRSLDLPAELPSGWKGGARGERQERFTSSAAPGGVEEDDMVVSGGDVSRHPASVVVGPGRIRRGKITGAQQVEDPVTGSPPAAGRRGAGGA